MKFIVIAVFALCLTSLFSKKYEIVGGGPVGLYLSIELLKLTDTEKVIVYEAREEFKRPQCLRLPFGLAKKFPMPLRFKLWPNETLRDTIFKDRRRTDTDFNQFWPNPGYEHFPRIQVGNFQIEIINYLKLTYPTKFSIIYGSKSKEDINTSKSDLIFFTAGGGKFNKEVRDLLQIGSMRYNFLEDSTNPVILDGIYITYVNKDSTGAMKPENYIRTFSGIQRPMNRVALSADGLTYSATNNENGNVQLYTYDVGDKFKEIYRGINDTIKKYCAWPKSVNYKTGEIIEPEKLKKDE